MSDEDSGFRMSEPAEHVGKTQYAFWLQTEETRLFRFMRTLVCVESVKMVNKGKALVAIKDIYDPDEAWHYIRTQMEGEAQFVVLDKIWEDAMKWL